MKTLVAILLGAVCFAAGFYVCHRGQQVGILSTGGCIVDPRPKPVRPGGSEPAAEAKASLPTETVLLTYYQDDMVSMPLNFDLYFTPSEQGDALEVLPHEDAASSEGFTLSGNLKEHARLSLEVLNGMNQLLVRGNKLTLMKLEHDALPQNREFLRPNTVSAAALDASTIKVRFRCFGVDTGFVLRRASGLSLQPRWLEPEGSERVLAIRPRAASKRHPMEMYQVVEYYFEPNIEVPDAEPRMSFSFPIPAGEQYRLKIDGKRYPSSGFMEPGAWTIEVVKEADKAILIARHEYTEVARHEYPWGSNAMLPATHAKTTGGVEIRFTAHGVPLAFSLLASDLRLVPEWRRVWPHN